MNQIPQQPQYQNPMPQQPPVQQPMMQQPPVQQPMMQQPMMQQQYQQTPQQYAKPAPMTANQLNDGMAKLLPILTIVFLILAFVSFLYYFIMAIVNAADYESFKMFCSGFANAIGTAAKYVLFAGVTAFFTKKLDK